jgi:hypothetical protein
MKIDLEQNFDAFMVQVYPELLMDSTQYKAMKMMWFAGVTDFTNSLMVGMVNKDFSKSLPVMVESILNVNKQCCTYAQTIIKGNK